tara:strand:+ start:4665 stop:5024 length:360 start_codon:yes stop_codon:yes gene_type:complete
MVKILLTITTLHFSFTYAANNGSDEINDNASSIKSATDIHNEILDTKGLGIEIGKKVSGHDKKEDLTNNLNDIMSTMSGCQASCCSNSSQERKRNISSKDSKKEDKQRNFSWLFWYKDK